MSARLPTCGADLETLQRETFDYFIHEANPANGLIIDKTKANCQPAVKAPFMYHCHIFEHEENGMMGQFVTV